MHPGLHFLLKLLSSVVLEANGPQVPAIGGPRRRGAGNNTLHRDARAPSPFVQQPVAAASARSRIAGGFQQERGEEKRKSLGN